MHWAQRPFFSNRNTANVDRQQKSVQAIFFAIMLLVSPSAKADIILFNGLDSGSGPGGAQTNTIAAATAFSNASSAIGTVEGIDFESTPLVNFTKAALNLAPGVSVEHFSFGTSSGDSARVLGATINPNTGFNTTSGGSRFVFWTTSPESASTGAATLRFSFDEGIQGFGARFTNWGTNSGATSTLSFRFNDGAAQVLEIPRSGDAGGIQFSGFLDAGATITSMDISFRASPFGRGGELFGVDDILIARVASVPEPSSLWLVATISSLFVRMRRRTTTTSALRNAGY
ncbi:MAG: PEP-CTERM sorting domain-containing protein [Pirellulaceae bacterium]